MSVFQQTMTEVYNICLCGMIFLAGCGIFAIVADWWNGELS